jgi:putative transposase
MKHPALITYQAGYKRASLPIILKDFETLPSVDSSAFDADPIIQNKYERNLEAYRLYVLHEDVSLREIEKITGITASQLYRLIVRVMAPAPDGRIQGLRGLIPGKHLKKYERFANVEATSRVNVSNAAGAMQQLFRKYPQLEAWTYRVIRQRKQPLRQGEIRAVKKPVRQLHEQFLIQCRKAGVGIDQYPFNQEYRGYRSFQELTRKIEIEKKSSSSKYQSNEKNSQTKGNNSQLYERWPSAVKPFMVVQFDGHKIDVRLTLTITNPFGMETVVELHRIWILVVTDVMTKAVLGYHLALGKEYDKNDFAEAIQAAIAPHRPIRLTIPGLKVKDGGGFPTELQPELAYHRWNFIQIDEAKSHLARDSLDRLTRILGTFTMAGRLGEPNDRSYQERFFGLLEESGIHQLPGTFGTKPDDPRRRLGDVGKDLNRLITLDELEQLIYVLVANRNAEVQSGLGGRSALDAMQFLTSRNDFLIQTLPVSKRHHLFLLKEAIVKTVRGQKTIPHINFAHVRYTSELLARRSELVGQKIRLYFMARDVRKIHAFFEDGAELGILTASRQWRTTPHSLKLRQEIFKASNQGLISWGENDDPIEIYFQYKRGEASKNKRAANAIAKANANMKAADNDVMWGNSLLGPQPSISIASAKVRTEQLELTQRNDSKKKESNTKDEQIEPTPINIKKTLFF